VIRIAAGEPAANSDESDTTDSVAMPGLSGNHLIRVETGEMYLMHQPIPPSSP